MDTSHLVQLENHYASEKLSRMIKSLPNDVARHIYEEYFVVKETCDVFLNLLHTKSAMSLDYKPLLDPARRILSNACAIEYLCNKNPLFKEMYIEHYVKNHKNFVRISTLESFVLSILMYMYH